MESLFIALSIASFFGSFGGFIAIFAMPFFAHMIVKNRQKIELLQEANRARLDDIHLLTLKTSRIFQQIDGIESDLEKARLSSIAPVKGATGPVKLTKKPVLDKLKAKGVDSAVKNNVYHLSNSKQGGKRANKSRNR